VPVTQGLDPTPFPQFSRLAANLASMKGLLLCGKDALANGVIVIPTVHVKAQAAKFLLHL
jgi:hypothetical protein